MPTFIATAGSGTESLLVDELRGLGARDVRPTRGSVRFAGDLELALRTCLWSRVAMRVLLPLADFPAPDADRLYSGVRAIGWNEHLTPRHTFSVEAAGTSPTLRHTHFTALRVKDAIVDTIREAEGKRPDVDPNRPDVRVVAHLHRGRCEVSLDLSGDPLFKRGYRVAQTAAPLKETLAAAVLLAAGYDGSTPLVDPMCGSGTLAIEAALIATKRAPGLGRAFGVERWPVFDGKLKAALKAMRDEASAAIRSPNAPIFARDRDPEAVSATQANVRKAQVEVDVAEADARQLQPLDPPGLVVTNPPYGARLEAGGRKQLKTFFWQLGRSWRELPGHRVAVLSGGPEFESAFGVRPLSRQKMFNGPIECTLLQYEIPSRGPSEPVPGMKRGAGLS